MRSFFIKALAIASAIAVVGFVEAAPEINQHKPTPEEIKEVASKLVCLCGNCNRESLATCICTGFAVPERESIGRQLTTGMSASEIIANYVQRFGNVALAEPPPGSIRWVSVGTPIVVLVLGVLVIRTVLIQWRRKADPSPSHNKLSSADRSKYESALRDELSRVNDK